MQVMERLNTLLFECPVDYVESRCVTIDHANGTVVYTTAGLVPDGVTRGIANNDNFNSTYTIEVEAINAIRGSRFVDLAADVAKGDELEVIGVLGKVQPQSGGTAIGLRATDAGLADSTISAYRS